MARGEHQMTKGDIVENVYEKLGGFTKKETADMVDVVFDVIKDTLALYKN